MRKYDYSFNQDNKIDKIYLNHFYEETFRNINDDKNMNIIPNYNKHINDDIIYKIEGLFHQSCGSASGVVSSYMNDDKYDEYFDEAALLVIEKDKASIGYLQRMLRIGFNRAAHIMDQLEDFGVVGPEELTMPRKVLMTKEEFLKK